MPQITFTQAKKFLENINSQDKVAIIHHDDLDGFSSGIMLYDWCKRKKAKVETFVASYGKWKKSTSLKKYNKILIADIAPGGIQEINLPKRKEIFYTDHHPKREKIPKEILELRTSEKEYIPSSRTVGELTQIKSWLALAGTIADAGNLHKENEKFIKNTLKKYHISLKKFKNKIVYPLSSTITFFDENPEKAFRKLQNIKNLKEIKKLRRYSNPVEKEIKKQMKNIKKNYEKIGNIKILIINPKYSIRGILITKISMKKPEEIFIFLSQKKSNPKLFGISSRHQSDNADLPKLLNAGIRGLENAMAGGHKRAAGGQIQIKDLEKFKKNIQDFIQKSQKNS